MKFNLTTFTMYHWFNEFNEKYFDNKLFMPNFKIKKSKSYFGKCFGRQNLIIMSNYLDRTEKDFQNTFIHEMIHLWQWQILHEMNHGKSFKKKAAEINMDGWNIKRCSDNNGAQVINMKASTIYVLNFNYANRNCFSKTSFTNLYSAYNRFRKCKGVTNLKAYRCDNTPMLDRIPSITKSYRYWWGGNYEKEFINAINAGTELALNYNTNI